jgi:IS1 family transposase
VAGFALIWILALLSLVGIVVLRQRAQPLPVKLVAKLAPTGIPKGIFVVNVDTEAKRGFATDNTDHIVIGQTAVEGDVNDRGRVRIGENGHREGYLINFFLWREVYEWNWQKLFPDVVSAMTRSSWASIPNFYSYSGLSAHHESTSSHECAVRIYWKFRHQRSALDYFNRIGAVLSGLGGFLGCLGRLAEDASLLSDLDSLIVDRPSLTPNNIECSYGVANSERCRDDQNPSSQKFWPESLAQICFCLLVSGVLLNVGCELTYRWEYDGCIAVVIECLLIFCGLAGMVWMMIAIHSNNQDCEQSQEPHGGYTVPQQYHLTSLNYRGTVIAIGRTNMANVLPIAKQVAVISALAEGSGIRQAERMTGVNRETIMNLGVRVGKGCATLLDRKMRGLTCHQLQFDEIWGFIGKKERHLRPDDDPQYGDVWTFCAIDRDTKLVPSFKVGKRDLATADAFVSDVASRVTNRVQISADALHAYVQAIESTFGADVDFAQIVKTYITDDSHVPERKFSAPEIVMTEKKRVTGMPNMRLASTSHVERLNGTTRLHMRRLTRLTYAFSKKLENFEAAVGLHFAYYNFVKRHNTLRTTPAMAAGIERDFWSVRDLVEAAA